MSKFGDRRAFFESIYEGDAPWDIEEAQPALLSLIDEFPPREPILDVGCGTGDLVIALARRGRRTVGIDLVAAAIEKGRNRVEATGREVAALADLRVGDALRPADLGERFGAIVDSGFYHVFDTDQRDDLEGQLAAALLPGGRYYVLGFAIDFQLPNTPIMVTEEELRTRFSSEAGWHEVALRPATFVTRMGPVESLAACFERRILLA